MKIFGFGPCLVLGSFLACGQVLAADLPSHKAPEFPPSSAALTSDWTGLYVGVNGGFGTDRYSFPYSFGSATTGVFSSRGAVNSHGPMGGGQVGFYYQTPWNVVLGGEVDMDSSGIRGSMPVAFPGITGAIRTSVAPYYGALRLKFGYAFDAVPFVGNLLVVFAVGGVITKFHDQATVLVGSNPLIFDQTTHLFGANRHNTGVVGIGVAHKVSANIDVFADYRYTSLGSQSSVGARSIQVASPLASGTFQTRAMYHLARVGVNYHFDLFR